ncbi:hypothetical protein Hsc_0844 [Herbaspirillum seropedicae]|nr:hypothetical protein Hsc_0844 [Herbaspirillum seropedicae]
MHIQLKRTFGEFNDSDSEEADWGNFIGERSGRLTWSDLHAQKVSVVLGEAGIGKSTEFALENSRLVNAGKTSFFVALNQLTDSGSWRNAVGERYSEFLAWQQGDGDAFFFLDAVDETRLHKHSDLVRALWVVSDALAGHMHRVNLAISSRITDWSVPDVRRSVEEVLLKPISKALKMVSLSVPPDVQSSANVVEQDSSAKLFVVTLDALSFEEARRCARHYNLEDEDGFWEAVSSGEYTFMTSRPLDLSWMVKLWNSRRALGTYRELIEANIRARLREENPHYQQAGKALSESDLLAGAQELAAAAEFGGAAYISIQKYGVREPRSVDAFSVLNDWQPGDVDLLLGTAIFDEASFDRVQFHHRSIREYLAACWVNNQLLKGVPFRHIEKLFSGRVFGAVTVVPARRPMLSWLASINVLARIWVIRWCPDIFLHEGDAESWDQPSADRAFLSFLKRSKSGDRLHWVNSASEYRRVGRALSPGRIAVAMLDMSLIGQTRRYVMTLAVSAKLADCAAPAMTIFRNTSEEEWARVWSLEVLRHVGTAEQRAELLGDLKTGVITGNALIAKALSCVDLAAFSVTELADIFSTTGGEEEYGHNPMATAIKYSIVDHIELPGLQILLAALIQSAPYRVDGAGLTRYPRPNVDRAWIFDALPICFERFLILLKETSELPIQLCLATSRLIDELLATRGFVDATSASRLRTAVEAIPLLRWEIAQSIVTALNDQMAAYRLLHAGASLVTFSDGDLPELIRRANGEEGTKELRDKWFNLGFEIAARQRPLNIRRTYVRSLCGQGEERERRILVVKARYHGWRGTAQGIRKWKRTERVQTKEMAASFSSFVDEMRTKIDGIRDGSDVNNLLRLTHYALGNGGVSDSLEIDLSFIAAKIGKDVSDALADGLIAYWKSAKILNPLDFLNEVPLRAVVPLIGVHLYWRQAGSFAKLSNEDARTAALISRWSSSGPPSWFETLYRRYSSEVLAALRPWILEEAKAASLLNLSRGALNLALKCPSDIRYQLFEGLSQLLLSGEVTEADMKRALVHVLQEDGHLAIAEHENFCVAQLNEVASDGPLMRNIGWFQCWLEVSPAAAWNWFTEYVQSLALEQREMQVSHFASQLGGMQWLPFPWDADKVEFLLKIVDFLRPYISRDTVPLDDEERIYGLPIPRMLETIARCLVKVRGARGRLALQRIHDDDDDLSRKWNYYGYLLLQAEAEVAENSNWAIEALRNIHFAFDRQPDTEARLFEQAIARLEGIRTSVEEGPFSERDLFSPGMLEKHLQLWLASKFSGAPNQQFTVHREEEVDADKRTDIQLACSTVKVCIEIKPVDNGRYSANSLVEDTLKRQIVGQYLKGFNTGSGILVLLRLDEKTWDLPSGKGKSFDELVEYLQAAAFQIQADNQSVSQLTVFGINCVSPKVLERG